MKRSSEHAAVAARRNWRDSLNDETKPSKQELAIAEQQKALPTKKLSTVHVDITDLCEAAEKLQEMADRAEIKTAEDYAKGGDLIKISRTNHSKAEDLRKELSAPYHSLWKFINAQFKPVTASLDKVKTTIEKKMVTWKRAEDDRLAAIAKEEQDRIEAEALERAEAEKTEEGADEVMETAAAAVEKVEEKASVGIQRGNFGSSTGTRKVYTTNVSNQVEFLSALCAHIKDGNKRGIEIATIVDLKKSGLNSLAKDMSEAGVKKMPGAEFTVTDKIAVY